MIRRHHQDESHDNKERWLLTYSDLITLLMIFFIVMYTLSKIDANKFKALADSLSSAIGGGVPAKVDVKQEPGSSIIQLNPGSVQKNKAQANTDAETKSLKGIKKQIDQFAQSNGIQAKIETDIEERGLVVSIRDTLLFPSGSAKVTDDARQILEKLSTILSTIPNFIRVEGHTDNVPINTPQFPSNWELSTARAVNVLNVLTTHNISPERLSASGYGEYRPVLPNTSDANRDKNRRVDLVIIRSAYDVTEPQLNPSQDNTIKNLP